MVEHIFFPQFSGSKWHNVLYEKNNPDTANPTTVVNKGVMELLSL